MKFRVLAYQSFGKYLEQMEYDGPSPIGEFGDDVDGAILWDFSDIDRAVPLH